MGKVWREERKRGRGKGADAAGFSGKDKCFLKRITYFSARNT